MISLIQARAAAGEAILAVFDDAALLRAALTFEVELAKAQAAEGLIPPRSAQLIEAATAEPIAPREIAEHAAFSGTLAIAVVAWLRAGVSRTDPAAAAHVHLGATSQDLADTALMLQLQAATAMVCRETMALGERLTGLAERNLATPMIGRTLLQSALPITFGLKAAQWRAGVDEARQTLERAIAPALRLQLGGPVGTLAGLGDKAEAVRNRLAEALDLPCPPLPWHARRGNLAALGAAASILIGSVAKIATDVALMAQNEIAEAREPRQPGRGGSSAMAHKSNPTGCQLVRSAAIRAPGLVATLLAALPQEHERGLGGWQVEAPVLAELLCLAHGAVETFVPVIEGLEVDPAAMRRNLQSVDVGEDIGAAEALARQALDAPETP